MANERDISLSVEFIVFGESQAPYVALASRGAARARVLGVQRVPYSWRLRVDGTAGEFDSIHDFLASQQVF